MIPSAIIHSIWLLLQVDGISSMMENLVKISKGVITIRREEMPWGQISQQMKENLGGGGG